MAQASLTLDNSDGWLNVDYGEVVITRRTFRSGENEYFLNGARVRLRDINDLLAQSGLAKRTYTVIGQGLIDQALSLKPDERRALIEEAAGITGHQAKRATAPARAGRDPPESAARPGHPERDRAAAALPQGAGPPRRGAHAGPGRSGRPVAPLVRLSLEPRPG
jgi:hypothetical protein